MAVLLDKTQFEAMERRVRSTLINSLSGIRTAYIGISADKEGRLNASTLSNVTHVGASPAQMSILFRPDNGKRHTLSNYENGQPLTLVSMPFDEAEIVHQTSMNAPEGTFELDVLDVELVQLEGVAFPLPSKFIYAITLNFIERFNLNNGCVYTVGEVSSICINQGLSLDAEGQVDFTHRPTLAIGLKQYTTIGNTVKLPYPNAAKFDF